MLGALGAGGRWWGPSFVPSTHGEGPKKWCSDVICIYLGRTSWGWKSLQPACNGILDRLKPWRRAVSWNRNHFKHDHKDYRACLDVDVHPCVLDCFHISWNWLMIWQWIALSTCRKQQRNLLWAHWRSWSSSTVLGSLVGWWVCFVISFHHHRMTTPSSSSSTSSSA